MDEFPEGRTVVGPQPTQIGLINGREELDDGVPPQTDHEARAGRDQVHSAGPATDTLWGVTGSSAIRIQLREKKRRRRSTAGRG
jgi:hypothetical protein